MATPIIPGLYGKLPAAGDFISRRLPASYVKGWDSWLQDALTFSREQLGDDWLDVYLTSPIWRFIICPGDDTSDASVGILMPSVDRVGRYFPLTIAAMIDKHQGLPYLFTTAADWFDSLEKLALAALEDGFPLDEFDRKLCSLRLDPSMPPVPDQSSHQEQGRVNREDPILIEMDTLRHASSAFGGLGVHLLTQYVMKYSLWSSEGSDLLGPTMMVYHGMPPAMDFAGFLTGDWPQYGKRRPIVVSPFLSFSGAPAAEHPDSINHEEFMAPIHWRSSGRTDVGKIRAINEDAFLENARWGLWAVADGMGGHMSGDEASKMIVDGLKAICPRDSLELLIEDVSACLRKINSDLLEQARLKDTEQIMGSTVVVMLAVANRCATLWAGDSRLYRYRHGHLSQLTRDHSPGFDEMTTNATLTEQEKTSNIVTRALGAEADLDLDSIVFDAVPGDTYLLCSDGLVKEVNAQEIADILRQTDPETASRALIDLALAKGARDNVTVVVVNADRVPETTTSSNDV